MHSQPTARKDIVFKFARKMVIGSPTTFALLSGLLAKSISIMVLFIISIAILVYTSTGYQGKATAMRASSDTLSSCAV